MLHIENAQVDSQPVGTIEGQPNTGTFLVKPLIRGESMALLEIRARAGVASATHMHSHESLIYVVSGRLKTTVNDEAFVLGPGDVCRHPRAVSHRVEALEDTVFVEVKSPPVDLRQVFGLSATSGVPINQGEDKGMNVSESDWSAFLGHVNATLEAFQVPQAERGEVVAFVQSTKADIVEG